MKTLLFTIATTLLTSIPLEASTKSIGCTHPMVCTALSDMFDTNNHPKIYSIQIEEDPHHFSPSLNDIKKMKKANYLINAPFSLAPWGKKLSLGKDKHKVFTFQAKAKDHFWMYPHKLCQFLTQLNRFLVKNEFKTRPLAIKACMERKKKITYRPELYQKAFLLTHSALAPLFKGMKIDHFVIRGGHHGHSFSSKTLKSLSLFLKKNKNRKIVWIVENELEIPHQLLSWIKPNHQKLKINLFSQKGESIWGPYNRLIKALNVE